MNREDLGEKRINILLGQLGRGGDCLYATAVARQIKQDYPACHLTWAISSKFRSIIDGNPFVDEIWEISQDDNKNDLDVWNSFKEEVEKRRNRGEYDEIFLTQVHPGNFHNYDGTSRSSLFRGYPKPITVPIEPIVRLSDTEINNVKNFIITNKLSGNDALILFECNSTSGQSFVTIDFAIKTALNVLQRYNTARIVLTSNKKITTTNAGIIDGSVLSFKENAELIKYCSLFVGCSSGVSWLATSDWSKSIHKIQLLDAKTHMFASMFHDALYFGLRTDQILEMQNCSSDQLADCILLCLQDGFAQAKIKYHVEIPIKYDFYFQQLYSELFSKGKISDAVKSLDAVFERFRDNKKSIAELDQIMRKIVFPYLNIIWDNIDEREKEIISQRINIYRTDKFKTKRFIQNLALLIFNSFWGEHTSIARIFFRGLLMRCIGTEKVAS